MFIRKSSEREDIREEPDRQGIDYLPIIWSNFGKPHKAAANVIRSIARRVARRRGHTKPEHIAKSISKDIAVELWRRGARMSLASWPKVECQQQDGFGAEV